MKPIEQTVYFLKEDALQQSAPEYDNRIQKVLKSKLT